MSKDEHCLSQSSNILTVKSNCKKCHTDDKHNLTQDQKGTLSFQLNLICNVLCGYSINKLDLACQMWLSQR